MRVTLEILAGSQTGRKLWLQVGQIVTVGRSEWADFAVEHDGQMSRVHFALECQSRECRIRDRGSSNGTRLNGAKIQEAVLSEGDEVVAGQTRFAVQIEGPQQATEPLAEDVPASDLETSAVPAARDAGAVPTRPPVGAPAEAVSAPVAAAAPAEAPAELLSLVNKTPFEVETLLWEDLEGRAKLTVIVKVSCTIEPGKTAVLAGQQLPVLTADEPYGEDPASSIRLESDLVPYKPRADVVLVGRAHAPRGWPAGQVDVRLCVGRLERTLRVFGNRRWEFPSRLALVPRISKPEPFETMELVYERSFGGIDTAAALYCAENLVGTGFIGAKSRESVHEKPLPNLEDPANLIRSWDTRPKPVGFGFYGRGWMPRLRCAGTYDDEYQKERAPVTPLDFSDAFYNGAHPELQVEGYLQGDEPVALENLTPVERVQFRLPGIRPQISVTRAAAARERPGSARGRDSNQVRQPSPAREQSLAAELDTLVFLPEEKLFYEVFRAVCRVPDLEAVDIANIKITM